MTGSLSEKMVDISQAKILLVDDESEVRLPLTRSLGLLGFYADEANSGQEGLEKLKREGYDVMVLDLRMPGMDGVETMHRALEISPDLIVIILTGHATLNSAIAAVKAGAADYLCKPVSIHNLAEAISRAMEQQFRDTAGSTSPTFTSVEDDETLMCGPVTLNKGALWVAVESVDNGAQRGPAVKVTVSEAKVLACLMTHPNQTLTCEQLAQAALGYEVGAVEAQKIIRPHISRLRSKLGSDSLRARLIETIIGKGYVFRPFLDCG